MLEFIKNLDTNIMNIIYGLGFLGPILACLLIVFESILPILPLGVFITFNFLFFGKFLGFIISWVFTIVGCLISFYIFRKGFHSWFKKKIKNKIKIENLMVNITHLNFQQIVVLIAIPFTPAFLVNVAAGLSNMDEKKFIMALILGKVSLVYFWGYVGTSLLQSFRNPIILLRISFIVIAAYIISKLVNKKLNIN